MSSRGRGPYQLARIWCSDGLVGCRHVSDLLIRPNRSLPSEEFCLGTRPSQAASCRPEENRDGSLTVATKALAVIGPTPGIVPSRRLISFERCQAGMGTIHLGHLVMSLPELLRQSQKRGAGNSRQHAMLDQIKAIKKPMSLTPCLATMPNFARSCLAAYAGHGFA